ncbi:hypothetical protein ACPESR_11680 [Nocardia testacea]|uniref:hypothetical protein n=1 Tax=Nocardia testacea TaxID=248551 RepID=UPI003C2B0A61
MTIRIPGRYDFTYLNHPDGYSTVLSLPTDHGSVGPVLGLVPTVGFCYPRSGHDPDSLQELDIDRSVFATCHLPVRRCSAPARSDVLRESSPGASSQESAATWSTTGRWT